MLLASVSTHKLWIFLYLTFPSPHLVQFISASKEINERAAEYWPLVMDVARHNNVKRIVRCSQIMGRSDTEEMSAAQIFYPCMQCADIFFLKVQKDMVM